MSDPAMIARELRSAADVNGTPFFLRVLMRNAADLLERSAGASKESLDRILDLTSKLVSATSWRIQHEKVCAGTWVPVTERSPTVESGEEYWSGAVLLAGILCAGARYEPGKNKPWFCLESYMHVSNVTHFLDVRLPTGREG